MSVLGSRGENGLASQSTTTMFGIVVMSAL